MVLAHHLLLANERTGIRVFDFLSAVARAAWVGVDLFFVLSGFLITGILYDSLDNEGYFRKFYLRRVLRIFPLYYGVLFILFALTHPLHLDWHGKQLILLLYLQNTGLSGSAFDFIPSAYINLSHFWSLAVEEQFYLVWPFLVFWIRDRRRLIIATSALSIVALLLRTVLAYRGVDPEFIYTFTACRADSLLLGGCLAMLMRSRLQNVVLKGAWPLLLAAIAIMSTIAHYQHGLEWREGRLIETFGYTVLALAGTALIAETFRERSLLRSMFEAAPLRFLGKYSYGIYIFHYSVNAFLCNTFRAQILHLTHIRAISVAGSAFLVIAISILLAVISFRFYERPFLKLKKFFEYSPIAPMTISTPIQTDAAHPA